MRHSNPTTARARALVATTAAAVALSMSACGAITEKITEEGAERIIEAETGEDVELDLGGDGISIESDDGSFSLNDDGEIVVTDADGSVFQARTEDDGFVVTDGDGEEIYRAVEEIPPEWPSDVPRPTGLDVESGFYSRDGESLIIALFSESNQGPKFAEDYAAALASSGFEQTGDFSSSSDGTTIVQRSLENDRWMIDVSAVDDGAGSQGVQLTLSSQD